jgi:hypothetical protein
MGGITAGYRCRLLLFFFTLTVVHTSCSQKKPNLVGEDQANPHGEPVTFTQSASSVECYDFLEVAMQIAKPDVGNPFTDVTFSGHFKQAEKGVDLVADGFCDSPDGKLFRVRFMPSLPGEYTYSVTYRNGNTERERKGTFKAVASKRAGILRVDPDYPWHFIWEGPGIHCFVNGTTAFHLMGWENDQVIRDCIDRLHRLEVNRIRVLLDGRTDHFWTEPIKPGHGFLAYLNPWIAGGSDYVKDPRFDYTRFNCPYWQKFERMLNYAREKDMVVSVIFGTNDTDVHPVAGSADEQRYFRYAVGRLAAFSNVTWDLGDDLDSFRSEAWTYQTGTMLSRLDPYHHLATSHPVRNEHQDRTSPWFSMTSFQSWERPLHEWMLAQRQLQAKTGRIIADERRVRLRGSLPVLGALQGPVRLGGRRSSGSLGNVNGRLLSDHRRNGKTWDWSCAGYRGRLGERPGR